MPRLLSVTCALAVLAFAGAPAAAAEQAKVYPAAAVLGAVGEACSELADRDTAASRVAASGWVRASDPYATPVGDLVRFGYEAGRKLVEGQDGTVDDGPMVFSRVVEGETLYLVVSSAELGGVAVTGCRAYDAGETRAITEEAASRFVGRKPDRITRRPELTKYTWEPGLKPGQDSFEIFHVPADSPLIAMVKVSGIAIKADQLGTVPR